MNKDITQPRKSYTSKTQDYNIVAHLKKIPAQLSVINVLMISQELRDTLIHVLQNPEEYQAYFAEAHMTEALYAFGSPVINFSEEDLLLGTKSTIDPYMSPGLMMGLELTEFSLILARQ